MCKNINRAITAELKWEGMPTFQGRSQPKPQIGLVEADPIGPKLRLQGSDELSKVPVGIRRGRIYDSRTLWFVVVSFEQEHISIVLRLVIITTVLIP